MLLFPSVIVVTSLACAGLGFTLASLLLGLVFRAVDAAATLLEEVFLSGASGLAPGTSRSNAYGATLITRVFRVVDLPICQLDDGLRLVSLAMTDTVLVDCDLELLGFDEAFALKVLDDSTQCFLVHLTGLIRLKLHLDALS